jgi:hypothetical protein
VGGAAYIAEAFGFRKIVDATFMIGFLVTGDEATRTDIDKYLAALRQAQMEIDLRPELYKQYHLRAVPEKYRDQVDVRTFGTGERIVFLPYTKEVFTQTQQWTEARQLFTGGPVLAGYDEVTLA